MVLHILLLAILFIAAIFNLFFYFPTKKLSSWIHSLIIPTSISSKSSTDTSFSSKKEKTNTNTTTTNNNNNNNNNRAELRRVFATFDKNNDGFITKEELRESLKNIRIFVTEKEVEEMVLKLDANGDGLIDFEEFGLLCVSMIGSGGQEEEDKVKHGEENMLGNEEDLKEAFDVFDRDKDGLISVEELGSILSSLGLKEGKKMENCKQMIRKVDMDGDGMVNFEEFKRMMKSGGMLLLAS
ncbi:Parvalbumin [Parasponia andersonii]|uniref:Parvalbumin n=1 Tax=Parasponia andersonii TaxID=3476 RepID=A0A2P5DUT8_PARAD|nr:Parvalbumin [Parasponia andersonii]